MASIRGVQSFVTAVSAGSFAKAARELHVSAVAVSQNVARLERELGVRLLQRSTRKLGLTADGRLFYDRCTGPLRELEGAFGVAREHAHSVSGTVRVTSITPFGLSYVLPLIPPFTALYPKVEVELHLDDSVSDMIGQHYDVGIRVGNVSQATLVVRRLAALRFVVCASPEYLTRHPRPRRPSDLASHNCLRHRHRASGQLMAWTLVRNGKQACPAVTGNFIANDLVAIIDAAAQGQGLAYAPLPRILPLLRRGELEVVLPDWMSPAHEVFLHYPSRRGLPARVKVFVEFVVSSLRKHPDLHADPGALLDALRRA